MDPLNSCVRIGLLPAELTKRLDKRIPTIVNSAEDSGVWEGHVRYLGSVHFAEGEWVGVELNNRGTPRKPMLPHRVSVLYLKTHASDTQPPGHLSSNS